MICSSSKYVRANLFLSWFIQKGYKQGAFWAVMICLVGVTNDVLMRYLGSRLHPIEIVFFRFLFSMLSVLPFMLPYGKKYFRTEQPIMHGLRAIIGAIALALCCYSVNIMPLAENTTIMFGEPLFFLPLAYFLLKEKVDASRWIATLIGFGGLVVILRPGTETFSLVAFIPMSAAFLFALLNIMAKVMISDEHSYTLLFYFGLGTTLFGAIFLPFVWLQPSWTELFWLLCLGFGANFIQVCLFRAFAATDASALAPFRYTEFIFSAFFGFIFFSQIPTQYVLVGAFLIILSTSFITFIETQREKNEKIKENT